MSLKVRYFDNPFNDYSAQNAEDLIINGGVLNPKSNIATSINNRWAYVVAQLQLLDFDDYSVYTGTSGIALLKLLKNSNDKHNLKEIKKLLSLNKLKNKNKIQTFLCGDAGPLAIGAVVCDKLGEKNEMEILINRLISMKDAINLTSAPSCENLYGRAGYLFAILYVNKHIQPAPISKKLIRHIIEIIFTVGQAEAKNNNFKCPLMYQWHNSYYLGAAHGVAGIMYMLLQSRDCLTDEELNNLVRPTIDYLAKIKLPSGNYPSSLGSEHDVYLQWCHGVPGFVYLFSMAYKVYEDTKYLKLALEAGDIVWERGLSTKGYSICHGVSGNAYSFIELYQTTRDKKHLYRALKFAEWCLNYTREHELCAPDHPLSLFEGIAGPMYFLLDIQNPIEAKFPGFML